MSWLPSPIPHPLSYFDAPGWCKELLDWVIGMDWPEGDEQATWDIADNWYAASTELQDPLLESERAALDAVIAFGGAEGKVAAAIKEAWLQIGSGSDKSALQAAAFVTHALGEMLEGAGCDIQGAKLEYYIELGLLLIELIAMAVAAFFTFGASTAAAGPMCMATRFAIKEILKRLLKSLIERGIKRAVKDKLKDLGKDFGKKLGKWAIKAGKEGLDEAKEELLTQGGIQAYQNAIGRRHGVDLVDLAVSAGAGFAGGAASTLAGNHNGSFTSKMAHGARGEVLGELGGSAVTGQLPGLDNLGMSAVSGARGSATHHVTQEFDAMTDAIVGNLAAISLDGDPAGGITTAAAATTGGGAPPNTQPVHTTDDGSSQWPSAPAGGSDGGGSPGTGGSASLAGVAPPADTGFAPPGSTVAATTTAAASGPATGPVVAAPAGIPAQTGPAAGPAAAPAVAAPATGGSPLSTGAATSTGVATGGASAGLASTSTGTATSGPSTAGTGSSTATAGPATAGPATVGPATAGPATAGPTTAGPTTAGTSSTASTATSGATTSTTAAGTSTPASSTSGNTTSTGSNASTSTSGPATPGRTPGTGAPTPSGPTAPGQTAPTTSTATTGSTPANPATSSNPAGPAQSATPGAGPSTTSPSPATSSNPAGAAQSATPGAGPSTTSPHPAPSPAQSAPGAGPGTGPDGTTRDPGTAPQVRPAAPDGSTAGGGTSDPATAVPAPVTTAGTGPGGTRPDGSGARRPGDGRGDVPDTDARRWSDAYHGGLRAQRRAILASMGAPGALAAAAWDALNRHRGPDFATGGVTTDDVSALTGGDTPPSVDASRRYHQRGGYRPVLTRHQRELEDAVPRGADGRPRRFPSLSSGWLGLANDGGPQADPSRGVNCVDVVLSVADTWLHGRPRCAAPRTLDGFSAGRPVPSGGEPGGPRRIEDFFGGRLQQLCPNTRGMDPDQAADAVTDAYARLEQQLLAAGPGAMAVIIHQAADGTSHTWPVFNDGGVVMYADPQQPPGEPTTTPPFTDGIRRMDALVVAPDGNQSRIADAPVGAWSQDRPRRDAASDRTPEAAATTTAPGAAPQTSTTADPAVDPAAATDPAAAPDPDVTATDPAAAPRPDSPSAPRADSTPAPQDDAADPVPDPAGSGRGPAEPPADVMLRSLDDAELAALGVGTATLADLGYPDPSVLSAAQRATLEAMLPQVAVVPTADVRFTQRSVSPTSGDMSLEEFARRMGDTGWRGGPAHVVAWGDGSLTSLDNRRMRAARQGGLDAVPVCVHTPDEPLTSLPGGEDPERRRYRAPLTTEIRRLPDGTLVVGGDRGDVAYAPGTVPTTFGEAAMFRAAEQRSLLPGRLFGADVAPVTIGRPPGPQSVAGELTSAEAQVLASLHADAQATADTIMGDLSGLADAVSDRLGLTGEQRVQLRGTGERVKSLASLTRKFLVEGNAVGIDAFADGVNDVVRFSVQLPGGAAYRQAFDQLRAGLEADGYQLTTLKNFFRPGNRFHGLNATFTSPDGQMFEVQFPTAESFRAWELTHHAYEVMRQASPDDNDDLPDGPDRASALTDPQLGELPPRRVHAFLSMLAVNAQLGLDQGVPPGVADIAGPDGGPVGAVDTGFAKWITKNRRLWARYRTWLDGQDASFDGFADVLAEFGLDPDNMPVDPATAARLEQLDDGLLRVLRGGQVPTATDRDPDLGRPGRDDVEPSPEGLGVRPGGSALAAGQPDLHRPVGGDQQGGGRAADPADHEGDRTPAGRGDHSLDLPVEGRPAAERRLDDPAADDTPPDPMGTAVPPPPHDVMMRDLTDAELARLGAGRATLAELGFPDPSVLTDAERAQLEALLPRVAAVPTADVRVSQRSVSPFSGAKSMEEFAREMGDTGWRGGPAHVIVWGDGSLSSLDNRRLRAARLGGLDQVPVCLHTPNEPLNGEKGDTLAVDLRRLDDGTLVIGGDRGEIVYAKGTEPRTYGEAALFRAAWQRSLLPGRLYGADAVHVTITKPPAPTTPAVSLNEEQARVLARVHTDAQARALAALGHLTGIVADLNGQRGPAAEAAQRLQLQGTDHMVKTLESIQRKFWTEGQRMGARLFASQLNDAARFSVQLPDGADYPVALRQVIAALEGQGYELTKLKNFFRPGNRYHGLNATLRAPDGGLMEIQFPTADSYRAWQLTHDAYEVVRRDDELDPRRVHAMLSMFAVNGELGLNDQVPPGIEELISERFPDAQLVQDTSLLRWIAGQRELWVDYRTWLDQQHATFTGFGDVLDDFGVQASDLVLDPEVARELEGIDDQLLSDVRARQEGRPSPGPVHSGGDGPGRDPLGLRQPGVDVRPEVDRGVPLQGGEHGSVRPDHPGGGRSRLPDDQSSGRRVPGRGDHPLDLPVEGGHPGEPGLVGPVSDLTDDLPPDPAGTSAPPADVMLRDLTTAELAALGVGTATLADLGFPDPSVLTDAQRTEFESLRAWLDGQSLSLDGFADVLAEFALDPTQLPVSPDVAAKLENIDGDLLRGGQERAAAQGDPGDGGPGRDAVEPPRQGVDLRPVGGPLAAGQPGVRGPLGADQPGAGRAADPAADGRQGSAAGRGDHPLDLPVEGSAPAAGGRGLAADDAPPPDPMGRAFGPRPDTGLSDAERGLLDEVHRRAVRSSEVILDDLTDVAGDVERRLGLPPGSLELRDTAAKVKSLESLERKYLTEGRLEGPAAFAATVDDSVRFCLVLPDGADYRPALDRFMQGMAAAGYGVDGPPKDFWRPGNRFYGTNATFRAPDGTLFEVQLPTDLSYRVWHATHAEYEVLRDDDADPEPRVRALLRMIEVNRATGMLDAIPPGMGEQSKDTSLAKWISDNPKVWHAFVRRLAAQGRTPDDVIAEYDLAPADFPVTDKVAAALEGTDAVLPGALSQGRRGVPGPAADGPVRPGGGVPGVADLGSPGPGVALRPGDGARPPQELAQRLPAQAGPADRGGAGRPGDHPGDAAAAERGGDRGDLRGVAPQEGGGRTGLTPDDVPPDPMGSVFEPEPAALTAVETAMLDEVYETARRRSADVMAELQAAIRAVSAEVGSELRLPDDTEQTRFKGRASLERKYRLEGQAHGPDRFADAINDAVRFSVVMPDGDAYRPALDAMVAQLGARGYVLDGPPKDFWRPGNRFYGTNVTFRAADGLRFEVQFPTAQSHRVWHRTHGEYEVLRDEFAAPLDRLRAILTMIEVNRAERMADAVPAGMGGDAAKDNGLAKFLAEQPGVVDAVHRELAGQGRTLSDLIAEYHLTPQDFPVSPKVAPNLREQDAAVLRALREGSGRLSGPGADGADRPGAGSARVDDVRPSGSGLAVPSGGGRPDHERLALGRPAASGGPDAGGADRPGDLGEPGSAAERGGDRRDLPGVPPQARAGDSAGVDPARPPHQRGPADGDVPPDPAGTARPEPSDPAHPQWSYRAALQTRLASFELRRRQQESDALARRSAEQLDESRRLEAWARHYRSQDRYSSQGALCEQWADYHRAWSVEFGNRSRAAYNGTFTGNEFNFVTTDQWTQLNSDVGELYADPQPVDGRPYQQVGGLRPPLRAHQDDLVAAMPRNPDGSFQQFPDPRVGRWFGLANDSGPGFDPSRGINCLDCMLSLWQTWRGNPRVSAPRTWDRYRGTDAWQVDRGEEWGDQRAAALAGRQWETVFPDMSRQLPPDQMKQWVDWGFATLTHQLVAGGHGSAVFITTRWQGGGGHAWLAVNQNGTILFLDSQTGQISENVPMYRHDGDPARSANVASMNAIFLDAQGTAQPIPALAQTSWGRQANAQLNQAQTAHSQSAEPSEPTPENSAADDDPTDPAGTVPAGTHSHAPGSDAKAIARYARIRAYCDDVERIARITGAPEEVVARARRNIFLETHDVAVGPGPENLYRGHYFCAYDWIADVWTQGYGGVFKSETERRTLLMLLAHEYVESRLFELTDLPYAPSDPDYWLPDLELGGWLADPSPDHFGVHDLAPRQNMADPFGQYRELLGMAVPDVEAPLDLADLERVVHAVLERVRLRS
ncbi:toxin glutamine deamidase domain-containing protein [Catellatospora sp. KI3]|uniref:toxin glutamine deamidase domain-containing protein n=1 Tax=Catellatospora sp. KI3 TaxID=3041620 RepID=UPI0024832574|nr:toxin glutamine deamidase domain-containing protein [Catellatospora sp. KI3]MDI1464845.1 toxin glutamine deamidase domain-containing protein [Catellatospora sp. KI3]